MRPDQLQAYAGLAYLLIAAFLVFAVVGVVAQSRAHGWDFKAGWREFWS